MEMIKSINCIFWIHFFYNLKPKRGENIKYPCDLSRQCESFEQLRAQSILTSLKLVAPCQTMLHSIKSNKFYQGRFNIAHVFFLHLLSPSLSLPLYVSLSPSPLPPRNSPATILFSRWSVVFSSNNENTETAQERKIRCILNETEIIFLITEISIQGHFLLCKWFSHSCKVSFGAGS